MTTKEFKLKINQLFKILYREGCVSKQNFWCCRSCAWANFDDEYKNGYFVFTTEQNHKEYLSGSQYIYGNYPPFIYTIIQDLGLKYYQMDADSAIELKM